MLVASCGDNREAERELVEVTLTPGDPSISVGTSVRFAATGRFSDDTAEDVTTQVAWMSSRPVVAPIGDGVATGLAAGTTTISATLAGLTATTMLSVTDAQLVSIEVTPEAASIARGTTLQYTATGVFTDRSTQDLTDQVMWSSSSAELPVSIASGSRGLATALAGAGTATVRATDAGSGVFGEATVTLTAAVLVSIAVDPANQMLPRSSTESYVATGIYSDFTTQDLTDVVTWSSSDAAVAEISNAAGTQGTATTLTPGVTTITAVDPATGTVGETTLTVNNATLVSIAITPVDTTIAKGARLQFVATGHYQDGSTRNLTQFVSWSSSAPNVAGVSNAARRRGVATGKNAGIATITATDPVTLMSATTAITVSTATLLSITLTPTDPTIPSKTKEYFTATGNFSDGSSSDLTAAVSWSSSNQAIATISNQMFHSGTATGVSPGTVTITAFEVTSGLDATATLTVSNASLVALGVTPDTPSVIEGTTLPMIATGTFTDGSIRDLTRDVTWTSGNSAIATVLNVGSMKGTVSGVAAGTTSITATYPQTVIAGAAAVTVVP